MYITEHISFVYTELQVRLFLNHHYLSILTTKNTKPKNMINPWKNTKLPLWKPTQVSPCSISDNKQYLALL